MRPTPHLVIAAVALLLTLVMTLPRVGGSGLKSGPFTEAPRVELNTYLRPVIPGDRPLTPLASNLAEVTDINNPFLPPVASNQVLDGSGRLPPPPPFELAYPPPMPLPEK
jgi:hypothetical protein